MSERDERRPLEATAARRALRQEPGQSTADDVRDVELHALHVDLDAVLDGYEALLHLWAEIVASWSRAAVSDHVALLPLHLPERSVIDARAVLADVWRWERSRPPTRATYRSAA